MELTVDGLNAMAEEAATNLAMLNSRCMTHAAEKTMLKQRVSQLEKQLKELADKANTEDKVVPIKPETR